MIHIQVHLHTVLQLQTPQGLVSKLQYQCQDNCSIAQLMADLNIVYDPSDLLLVANGQAITKDYILSESDEIHFIPAISGG